jgi:hypothetical protein
VVADRGHASSAFRRVLRGRGSRIGIPLTRRAKHWRAKQGRPGTHVKTTIGCGSKLRDPSPGWAPFAGSRSAGNTTSAVIAVSLPSRYGSCASGARCRRDWLT